MGDRKNIQNLWKQWAASHPRWALVSLGTAVAGLALWLCIPLLGGKDEAAGQPTFTVRQGPLTISVLESGTIKAREQVTLKNEVEGKTTILSLAKEGSWAKAGDLLIELDVSNLEEALVDRQIKVQNAETAFIRARENLEVAINQAQSDEEKAELTYKFARDDLAKYQQGEFPKELKEAESRITVAEEELRRAEERLEWSQVLFKEKYLSQTELQGDELAAKKAGLELELAIGNRDLLRDFTSKRKLTELQSGMKQSQMALERARRKAKADVIQAEADFKAKQAEFQREQTSLEKVQSQIEKTKIYAPIDGMVVYATSAQGGWRGNAEPLEEGQEVRERQELIFLPVPGSIMAEVNVHESSLDKVEIGLPVNVTVDALPGRIFAGKVNSIAPLPDAGSVWLNPDLKVYNTVINLEEDTRGLRNGMSCRAEIIVETYQDAIYVPVQAVARVEGEPTVFLVNGGDIEPRAVKIGRDNNRMIKIESGLKAGEEVLLNPPLTPGTARVVETLPASAPEPGRERREPGPRAEASALHRETQRR